MADQAIEGEASVEQNVATLVTNGCQLSFSFLANSLVEVKLAEGDAEKCELPSSIPTDAVLTKINEEVAF